jgi:hypothetical protein
MSGINWQMGVMPDIGGNVMKAFQEGQKVGDEMRRRKALQDWSADPQNPQTLNALMAVAPELGFKAAEHQRKQAEGQREREFGGALSEYMTSGGGNALLGGPSPGAGMGALSGYPQRNTPALPREGQPTMPVAGNALAPAMMPQRATASSAMPFELPDSRPDAPDMSSLGQPQNGRDRAFLRMVQVDPIKALKIRSTLRDNFVGQLKDTREVYAFAIDRLSQTTDQASYQAVIEELAPMAAAIGGDLAAHVPPTYPGPDGLNELLLRAVDVKDRIGLLMRQADIDADNERADRNTDSLIKDRDTRRGETRRYHDLQAGNTRRGQDIRSRDTRRGQDRRGSGSRSAAPRENIPTVRTPEEAMKLKPGTKFKTPDGRVKIR